MASPLFITPAKASDEGGNPYSGAVWSFYLTGTLTPAAVYADATLATSLGSSVTADAGGKFADIYLDPATIYRAVLRNSSGSDTVFDIDPYNISQPTFLQEGAGAVERTPQAKNGDFVTVKDFGAEGDGVTNDSAAFLAALTAHDCVWVPAGSYLLNTNITVPAGRTLKGAGRSSVTILTTANVTTLSIGGAGVAISGMTFDHSGDGKIIDATQDEDLVLADCAFQSAAAAATNPLVLCTGSFAAIRDCVLTNSRAAASYALVMDRTGVTINIESHITECRFGGTGKGIWIGSSDNSARPEGIYLTNTTFICTNVNLHIEQVLQMTVATCVFDQGNAQNVVLKPVNTGIEHLQFTGSYFSTPNSATVGVGIDHDNTNPAVPLRSIAFAACTFAFCGYGMSFKSGASDISVGGATSFAAIGSGAISFDQSRNVVISTCTFRSISGANLILTDGASGGPFVIDANIFDSATGNVFTRTSNAKFVFGLTNRGRVLSQWCSVATDTTAKPTGSYVAIPHGLEGTPLKERIVVSLIPAGSTVMSQGATALVSAVDSSNITVQVDFTVASGGNYNVTAMASL